MTPKQKSLYWRLWQRVYKQLAKPAPDPALVDSRTAAVRTAAEILARDSVLKPDHYRHAIHLIALGDVQSSKTLTKPQFDRVVAYMQSLLDPSDAEARERNDDATISKRRGVVAQCKRLADEEYIDTICRRKFAATYCPPWWEDLPMGDLRQLLITLVERERAKKRKGPQ